MKSSYELAMERLSKASPTVKLTAEQKKQIADLESKYAAKIAEREISLGEQISKAASADEFEKVEQLRAEFNVERKKFQAELEEQKERVRKSS